MNQIFTLDSQATSQQILTIMLKKKKSKNLKPRALNCDSTILYSINFIKS